jgi:hypothetical protein
VLHTAPLAAQEETFKFELTPFAAYRMGGSFEEKDTGARVALHDSSAQGITFNIKANPNAQYEFLYSRQSTDAGTRGFLVNDPDIDLDVETFHFGGTYLFDGENTRPFIALTIGVTQFDPGIVVSGSESFFSASLGAGVQLNATRRLGFRQLGRRRWLPDSGGCKDPHAVGSASRAGVSILGGQNPTVIKATGPW